MLLKKKVVFFKLCPKQFLCVFLGDGFSVRDSLSPQQTFPDLNAQNDLFLFCEHFFPHPLLSKLRRVPCFFHILGRNSFESGGDFGESNEKEELNIELNVFLSAIFLNKNNLKILNLKKN